MSRRAPSASSSGPRRPHVETGADVHEIAYRLDATLSDAALSGHEIRLDAANRRDLDRLLEGTGWRLVRTSAADTPESDR